MIIAIGVALAGFLLIYLEFFVPGGILGILGGGLLVISAILFFGKQGPTLFAFLYLVLLVGFFIGVVRLALWRIKKSKGKNTLYAAKDQEGYQAAAFDTTIVGKEGTAWTNLKPAGHILVDDKRYQAVTEGGYIRKGEVIVIIRGEGARFIVRRKTRK